MFLFDVKSNQTQIDEHQKNINIESTHTFKSKTIIIWGKCMVFIIWNCHFMSISIAFFFIRQKPAYVYNLQFGSFKFSWFLRMNRSKYVLHRRSTLQCKILVIFFSSNILCLWIPSFICILYNTPLVILTW